MLVPGSCRIGIRSQSMEVTVSVKDGIDSGNPNQKLRTINGAIEILKQAAGGPHTILVEAGVYREAVAIPRSPNLQGLSILGLGNANTCVISGADILGVSTDVDQQDSSILTGGWDDLGKGIYRIRKWQYTFADESISIIKAKRSAYYREATKTPGYLSNYPLQKQICEDFSEHKVWVIRDNQTANSYRKDLISPPLRPQEEMHEVFSLDRLQPGTFCVVGHNGVDPDYDKCFPNDGFPAGLYVQLHHQRTGEKFEEYVILVSRRHVCLNIQADDVTVKSIGMRLAAAPSLQGAVEIAGCSDTKLESCISSWNRGIGMVLFDVRNTVLHNCWSRFNGQEGITLGVGVENSTVCQCRTLNNSLSLRNINVLPPTHENRSHWPMFSSGGLVMKGAVGTTVIDHESKNNLGNGIWQDHGGFLRILGGHIENNFGSGISLERTEGFVEVYGTVLKENYRAGLRAEGEDCYLHNNYIIGNRRSGIIVQSLGGKATTSWVLNNTAVGNHRGLAFDTEMLNLLVVNNIFSCSKEYTFYPHNPNALVGQVEIRDNLISHDDELLIPVGPFDASIRGNNAFARPQFVDACRGDYALQPGSPGEGQGEGISTRDILSAQLAGLPYGVIQQTCGTSYLRPDFRHIGATVLTS